MSLRPLVLLITLLSASTLTLAPREASAQVVGLDAQLVVGLDRVGLARVQAGDADSSDLLDARVGGRVGMGRVVQIGGYAHAGWSFIGGDAEEASRDSLGSVGFDSDINGGFSYDVGLFVDIPVTPLVWVGFHGGYNRTEFEIEARERSGAMRSDSDDGHFQWFDVGVHVSARVF